MSTDSVAYLAEVFADLAEEAGMRDRQWIMDAFVAGAAAVVSMIESDVPVIEDTDAAAVCDELDELTEEMCERRRFDIATLGVQ